MTESRKLTRSEACAALEQRLRGLEAMPAPGESRQFFTDRDAADVLARWIKAQNVDVRESFQDHFALIVSDGANTRSVRFFDALLATPEQITLAACRTLKLNVE